MRILTALFTVGFATELYIARGERNPWLSLALAIAFAVLANVMAALDTRRLASVSHLTLAENDVGHAARAALQMGLSATL